MGHTYRSQPLSVGLEDPRLRIGPISRYAIGQRCPRIFVECALHDRVVRARYVGLITIFAGLCACDDGVSLMSGS